MALKMFSLQITELSNAAFCDELGNLPDDSQMREIARILRAVADRIDATQTYPTVLKDLNGNRVGNTYLLED